jgi:hypothetical protein
MAITQPTYPSTTSAVVSHVGAYTDAREAAEAAARQAAVDAEATARAFADSGKANTVHSHAISDVTGLQTALDAKADDSEIASLDTRVDSLEAGGGVTAHAADTTGVHGIADTSVLVTATDLSTGLATKAATSHSHAISDVTSLQSALDAKATATSVSDHLSDTSDAHDASAISYAGGTGMSATDVEAALDELATEKANAADVATDSELSTVKGGAMGVVIYSSGWPARPTGYAAVHYIGGSESTNSPVDQQANDLWTPATA